MKTKLSELSPEVRKRVKENNLELDLIDIPRENPLEFQRCPEKMNCEYNGLRRECFFDGMYRVCPIYNEYQSQVVCGRSKKS